MNATMCETDFALLVNYIWNLSFLRLGVVAPHLLRLCSPIISTLPPPCFKSSTTQPLWQSRPGLGQTCWTPSDPSDSSDQWIFCQQLSGFFFHVFWQSLIMTFWFFQWFSSWMPSVEVDFMQCPSHCLIGHENINFNRYSFCQVQSTYPSVFDKQCSKTYNDSISLFKWNTK